MRTTSFLLLFLMCFSLSARKKSKKNIQVEEEIIQIVEPAVMEPVVIELGLKDTISDTAIMVPEALDLASDELLSEWFAQNHTFKDPNCISGYNVEYPDSVYIQRLAALPVVMDMTFNPIVKSYINTYAGKRRSLVEYMLGLGNYYFPIFEEVLDKNEMPMELKYLPIIESALKPTVKSRVGATGLWQFMHQTGVQMGLNINSLVDERCDPLKSTEAAAKYLRQLYGIYNDWTLALAAYNCGPGNVNKAIKRSGGKKSYWDIYFFLPRETRGYVPAFIAATYIMNYYQEHNICPVITDIPAHTDTIVVNQMVHFEQICSMLDVSVDQLRMLNPQYRRDIIPGNTEPSVLRLPVGNLYAYIEHEDTIVKYKKEELLVNTQRMVSPGGGKSYAGSTIHRVKSGETLGAIARKYGTTVREIKNINNLKSDNLRIGQQLQIFGNAAKSTSSGGNSNNRIHTVKSGENLWSISKQYSGVTVEKIKTLNNISGNNLKVGQKIKIPN